MYGQPTTNIIDNFGNIVYSNDFVKKDDYNNDKKNYLTTHKIIEIIDNKLTNALTQYTNTYKLKGLLSTKSGTNHTHTVINNKLTINAEILELIKNNRYVIFAIGENNLNSKCAFIAYNNIVSDPCLELGIRDSKSQLKIYNDRLIYNNCLIINDKYDQKIFSFNITKHNGRLNVPYLEFKRPDSNTEYEWRIYCLDNHNLDFFNNKGRRAGYISCISNNKMNVTIKHNAPIEEPLNNYNIGYPVFLSGKVYSCKDNKYITETNSTNCIPSVKSTGTYKEYIGIIVDKHKANDDIEIGEVFKNSININQDTIDFATHGDFYFKVNDSTKYNIGDTILYDGTIINDDTMITNKIIRMTVGIITGIIDNQTISVFKE